MKETFDSFGKSLIKLKDDPRWTEMLRDRNLTVHTYNEKTAEEVYGRLPNYLEIFENLKNELNRQIKSYD